ncbi:MAG: VCBS repeat-containing protein [Cyclobacteriaceae bacterium]
MNFKSNFLINTALIFLAASCNNIENNPPALAKRHCSTCHAFTEPSLLTKKIWDSGVFPEMAYRMGLDFSRLPMTTPHELKEILNAIPATPLVTEEEWKTIKEYYIRNAPDTLPSATQKDFLPLQQFNPSLFQLRITNGTALTMIEFDDDSKNFYIGTRKAKMFQLTASLELEDSFQLASPPSSIIFQNTGQHIVALMGIMDPNDQPAGTVVRLTSREENPLPLIDSLKRPVYIDQADLNNDGQKDLVVSAFGNLTGALLAFEKTDHDYRPHLIHPFPGTRKTIICDFNQDGLPDILALITQGNEQIALFTNRGNFKFSYRVLLRFPAVYGSSYFELCDFNKDGSPDILYTNGDNADYSAILKPYHGVRIFLNDGKNDFSESLFYPLHGASVARAIDFDEDGDLDIAAISFFPDFRKHPEQGFVYFQNNAGSLTPYITKLAGSSRWITMESADIDRDNDVDLLLGALTFPNGVPDSLYQEWGKQKTSLLILRNNLR